MLDKDLSIFTGFGTHNKPLGTHSDDTSLTLCLAEALLNNRLSIYNYEKILTNSLELFSEWLSSGKWAVNNEVFDVGFTTRKAILKYNNYVTSISTVVFPILAPYHPHTSPSSYRPRPGWGWDRKGCGW